MKVTVTNGCCKLAGIVGEQISNNIKVYPNPAKTVLNVEANIAAEVTMQLFDQTGRLVWTKINPTDKAKMEINVSTLPRGLYYVKILSGNKEIYNSKVLIE